MGIFDKLFGNKKPTSNDPNNDKLIAFLEKYGKHQSPENYKQAFHEIVDGNSFLILPSVNESEQKEGWKTLKENSTLALTSVFDQDGLKVLGAFTSSENLIKWANKETHYTAMKSQDVIDFCQAHRIDRIVIDSDMPTMFVLERNRDTIKTETIQQATQVTVGTPLNPIHEDIVRKLQTNFAKVSVIQEVYHYLMVRNNENILMLGFVLDTYSDNSRAACINSVQNAMEGENLELPLEMFMLNDSKWLQTVKAIQDSLIFKR